MQLYLTLTDPQNGMINCKLFDMQGNNVSESYSNKNDKKLYKMICTRNEKKFEYQVGGTENKRKRNIKRKRTIKNKKNKHRVSRKNM